MLITQTLGPVDSAELLQGGQTTRSVDGGLQETGGKDQGQADLLPRRGLQTIDVRHGQAEDHQVR